MVILRGKSENGKGSTFILLGKLIITHKPSHRELSTLNPELGRVRNRLPTGHPAIRNTDRNSVIPRRRQHAGIWLELAVKELVKVLKVLDGLKDFLHLGLETVELDEGFNVAFGAWVVEFFALLEGHVGEDLADVDLLSGASVEQANAQADERWHLFLQHRACCSILHNNVCIALQ